MYVGIDFKKRTNIVVGLVNDDDNNKNGMYSVYVLVNIPAYVHVPVCIFMHLCMPS